MEAEIKWIDAAVELPDDEMTVLVALADGEVWIGFRDGDDWRYVSADFMEAKVTHWAAFPEQPQLDTTKEGTECRNAS